MQLLKRADGLAFGILTIGALGSVADSLTRRDRSSASAKLGTIAYYGLMGGAATYRLIRMAAPKPASERRLEKLTHLNDQAEHYRQDLHRYRHTAERLLRLQYRNLKTMIDRSSKSG